MAISLRNGLGCRGQHTIAYKPNLACCMFFKQFYCNIAMPIHSLIVQGCLLAIMTKLTDCMALRFLLPGSLQEKKNCFLFTPKPCIIATKSAVYRLQLVYVLFITNLE